MKIKEENQLFIYKEFHKMNTKWDLLVLLNYTKCLIYGELASPFKINHLHYYSNPKINENRYTQFDIKKKSGKSRIIHAPVKGLKEIQKSLNVILQCVFKPHIAATGFVPGKSVVDNAKIHIGSYYVYNIDLKDFFHSIDQARVWKCLQNKPLNLALRCSTFSDSQLFVNQIVGLDSLSIQKHKKFEIVNIISALTCTGLSVEDKEFASTKFKNVLPQGAPTSPIITNIVCQRLDYLLSATARRFGLKYSRYADDITFSSLHNVYQDGSEFLYELNRIIKEQGFVINETKTRLQKDSYRQEVTGLIVNNKVNVKGNYIKDLRTWLYTWERYGLEKAQLLFGSSFFVKRDEPKQIRSDLVKVLQGKLNYLKMVKGKDNDSYIKLNERFKNLNKPESKVNKLLLLWSNQGIESAMNSYYNSTLSDDNGKI